MNVTIQKKIRYNTQKQTLIVPRTKKPMNIRTKELKKTVYGNGRKCKAQVHCYKKL